MEYSAALPDMSIPPPSVPSALGSKMYPFQDLNIDDKSPPALQLRVQSLQRQKYEHNMFYKMKHCDYENIRLMKKLFDETYLISKQDKENI